MIVSLAIATGLLAVLDDSDEDFNELFQRAVLLKAPEILMDRLSSHQRSVFFRELAESRSKADSEQKDWWNQTFRLFRPPSYSVTYDIVDPDDCEDGEPTERGFVVAGGFHAEMPDGLYGDEARKWMDETGIDLPISAEDWWEYEEGEDPLLAEARAMAKVLIDDGVSDEGHGNYIVYDSQDIRTGTHESRSYHLSGFTEEQEIWIQKLVKIGKPGGDLS